jgi:hypothetical protein
MRWLKRCCLLVLIAGPFLLSGVRALALPANPEEAERAPKSQRDGATAQRHTSPEACPSVTVIVKEPPAQEPKQIAAVIQRQPYEHFWDAPNAPEWALFFLTIPYVLVSGGLLIATRRQAEFVEKSLTVVERAYIDLRVSFEDSKEPIPDAVRCTVFNNGRTPAILTELSYIHKVYEVVPAEPEYSPPETGDTFVAPDDPGLFASRSGAIKNLNLTADQWEEIKAGTRHLCVVGFVAYKDMSGDSHKTGFGWTFKAELTKMAGKPRLGRMDQPSYNYWK